MSSRLTRIFLISLLLLSCKPKPPLPAPESLSQIPLLPNQSPDTWPAEAYQIQVLNPRPANQPPNTSRLALAWDNQGLHIWAEVRDNTPSEGSDKALWMGDSLELFVASPYGSGNWIQLLCSPGRTPEHPRPRWKYIDNQKGNTTPLEDPVVKVTSSEKGYLLSLVFPWNNLLQPPKENESIGVQAYLNNFSSAEGKSRLVLFPSEEKQSDPKNYQKVQLSRRAGNPQRVVASLEIEKLQDISIKVIASPDLAGKSIELRPSPAGDWIRIGALPTANGGQSIISIPLPGSLRDGVGQQIDLRINGIPLPSMEIPDVREARIKVLKKCDLLAKPSVLGTSTLPPLEFQDKELVQAVFGPLTMNVRYFNSAYEEVKSADKPGRYGALVDIKTADGLTEHRRITLFRTPLPFSDRKGGFGNLRFPPEFGLSDKLVQQEKQATDDFLSDQLFGLASKNKNWAMLLAGLDDSARHPRELHGFDIWSIDLDWWLGLEKKLGLDKPYPYLLYLPKDYDANPDQKWPLLVFLHGSGERGEDLNLVKKHGPPKLIEAGQTFPFIVVAPQCPLGEWWGTSKTNDLVDQIASQYRVDPKRIYITGLSMGGYSSWNIAAAFPNKYAALAPICGSALPDLAPRLTSIPIWAFQGGSDESVPPELIQSILKEITRLGGKPKYTLYPGVGHDSWTQAYNDPNFYTWLLQQHR